MLLVPTFPIFQPPKNYWGMDGDEEGGRGEVNVNTKKKRSSGQL